MTGNAALESNQDLLLFARTAAEHRLHTLRHRDVKSVVLKDALTAELRQGVVARFARFDASEGSALSDVAVRFGRRLREVRQDRGISQEKLAELAGLHRTYVSSVERGERNISLFNIESLAHALHVKMAELMPDWRASAGSRSKERA